MKDLDGKVAIVTGGNRTLGKETALALAARGAEVIIACRNVDQGNAAAAEIRACVSDARVSVAQLELHSLDSVRSFATEFKRSGRPLHVLVANAGANLTSMSLTSLGVPLTCQVNYLGHYALARLLEPVLIASVPARIVSVSSVTHRLRALPSPAAFLSRPESARYPHTKLAQVFFTYEAQRRLGHLGVEASAVDPGGVRSDIWKGWYARPPISWYIRTFLAPPSDGAKAIVHAATADYSREAPPRTRWPEARAARDLRFYVKGLFGSRLVTWYAGEAPGLAGQVSSWAVHASVFIASLFDWPVRGFTDGRWLAQTRRCTSVRQSYDPKTARDLWNLSAEIVGVPTEPQYGKVTANGRHR